MLQYLSVHQLTTYLKLKFDRDPYLEKVYVTGQVSNFRKRPNHQYFSLKDDKSVLQATMWASVYRQLGFELEEGMKVNVVGRIQLYAPNGSYSIVIEKVEPDGIGALAIQFEQLKQNLTKEGLFKEEFKQVLPPFVRKIGVITSPSGAVIQDIITTVQRRFSGVEIVLYPTKVQGDGAVQEVARNIKRANERNDLDILIVGRGGGSIEDLWAFNEELVVRAMFESRIPIISSVGHETDTTLADFVADKRAATPTAAAELATPISKADIFGRLNDLQNRAYQALSNRLAFRRNQLERVSHSVIFRQPERLYDGYIEKVDRLTQQLQGSMKEQYSRRKQASQLLVQRLQGLQMEQVLRRYQDKIEQQERLLKSNMANVYDNKLAKADKLMESLTLLDTGRIVARGYAMVVRENTVVDSTKTIRVGEEMLIRMKDGQLGVEVKHVTKNENI